MPVMFQSIRFDNTQTGLTMPVKIEAPIGNLVKSAIADPGLVTTIDVFQKNCASVRIVADDQDHGATQDFVLAPPMSGRASYLQNVDVQFTVGELIGSFTAATES
jgi:hypothetical protein